MPDKPPTSGLRPLRQGPSLREVAALIGAAIGFSMEVARDIALGIVIGVLIWQTLVVPRLTKPAASDCIRIEVDA